MTIEDCRLPMNTLALFLQSVLLALLASLAVSGLMLPVAGFLQGGTYNCLNFGLADCVSTLQVSLLIYGPLFSILGTVIGTPVLMVILGLRR